jgi:hypothetical protein
MAMPGYPSEVPELRPRARWYFVPIACIVAAIVLFGSFIAIVVSFVRADMTQFTNGGTVPVGAHSGTVYVTTTDFVSTSCRASDQNGRTYPADGFSSTVTINDRQALASLPKDIPAGTYRISCPGVGNSLFLGKRVDLDNLGKQAIWGVALPIVLGVTALVFFIVLPIRRGRAKNRLAMERAAGQFLSATTRPM